jgi:Asp-tRNA(Asn)/Glu-tRNA(Gln) amidotransferase A subunit family amidase
MADVDFIALPTVQTPPRPIPLNLRIGLLEALMLERQNTVAVNFAGNPRWRCQFRCVMRMWP